MVREFRNDNGITYQIIAENKELDRTLLCNWTNDGSPRYIGAWGIDHQRKYWAQGHYFMDNLQAAVDYVYGKDNKTENSDHHVSIGDFVRTLSKETQIAIYDISKGEWIVGCDCAYNSVGFWNWSNLPDDLFVENVELHHDPDAGDGLWIDVAPDPRD